MAVLSLRAYAASRKRRGLPGGTLGAVQKAISTGRLKRVPGGVDAEAADRDWASRTDPSQQRVEAERVRAEAEVAGRESKGKRGLSLADARAAREVVRLRREALALEREASRLVSADEVEAALDVMFTRFRARCLAIPPRVADRLAHESKPATCHEIVLEEIERALAELSKPEELGGAK